MAMIKCPECGNQVSDRATACPNCAYPIKGCDEIRIRTQPSNFPNTFVGKKITLYDTRTNNVIWEGTRGQVIVLKTTKPIPVYLHYHGVSSGAMKKLHQTLYPGKKYGVSFTPGIWMPVYAFMEIDVIDAD